MRNEGLARLDHLIGEWELTLSDAWFLESLDVEQRGYATFEWLDDAFVAMTGHLEGEQIWDFVFGRSDPVDEVRALSRQPRSEPTLRCDLRRRTMDDVTI